MVVEEWPRGIRVKQSQGKQIGGGKRGRVVDLSRGSRDNLAWVYVQGPWRSMLTLTYHETYPDGATSKQHLNTWLQHLRRKGIKYLWVLEWQGRGFPHYHVWMDAEFRDCPLWEDESDTHSWRPLMMHWLNITQQNVNQKTIDFALHQKTFCPWEVRAGNNYASKYASKQDQKGLPVGVKSYGRWWGASVGINKPIRSIEIPEFSDIPEEKDNLTNSVKFKRDAKRALEHWSTHPPKKRHTLSGFRAVLRENRKIDICRILSNYFPNPFDKKCQNQYARRAASLRQNDDKVYNLSIKENQEEKNKNLIYEEFDFELAQLSTQQYIAHMQSERQRHDDMIGEFVHLYYQNMCQIKPTKDAAKKTMTVQRLTKVHFWMRTIKSDESAKLSLNALTNLSVQSYIVVSAELASLLERWSQNAYRGV